MNCFEYYEKAMNEVFEKNPTSYLEELLGQDSDFTSMDVIKLIICLEKNWSVHSKHNVQLGIIIEKSGRSNTNTLIYNYDFENDIKEIIQNGLYNHIIYVIDNAGAVITKNYCQNKLQSIDLARVSNKTNSISFYLGINGIDVYISGKTFELQNHLDSYKDIIYLKLVSISEYKDLLEKFFHEQVEYDPFERYFYRKDKLSSAYHDLLKKYPKALYSKPEKIFQMDLKHFLDKNCKDIILKEVENKNKERYDIWVLSDDKKLYVFELKWLGISITSDGVIFDKYNCCERAVEGAYQLKDYIDNAEKYSYLSNDTRIHCGVLVVFDSRENMDDIEYPEEFKTGYPQLDLYQQFKIEKMKVSASKIYSTIKKSKAKKIKLISND